MRKIYIFIKAILFPVLVGWLVGIIIADFMDYTYLVKPIVAPPGIAFPIVWIILYILMGISYGILENRELLDDGIRFIYYLQLIVNAIWPIIFFVLRLRLLAFAWIFLLAILVVLMIEKFYFKNKLSGILQFPYLIWTIFAAYLNLSMYLLNK